MSAPEPEAADILAMKAGPQLDGLAGQKVMDWQGLCDPWRPSTDYAAARLLEDEIERRELQDEYVRCLLSLMPDACDEVAVGTLWYVGPGGFWAVLRATPEQRTKAAILTFIPD